jgi:SAM-dependent methyltransferase
MSWITSFHDDLLAETLLQRRDPVSLLRELHFLEKELSLFEEAKVLDQCCGIGSLSIPLSQRGYKIHAVDITPSYIEEAKKQQSMVQFSCEDACSFVVEDCDAVFNWWTGFGYLPTDKQNKQMITAAFDSLRSGGRYLLDVLHPAGVLRHFQPMMRTECKTEKGIIQLHRETEWNLAESRMNKNWKYFHEGQLLAEHDTSVRVYHSHELVKFFQEVGFVDIRLMGNLDGESLDIDHLRCICIGRKS